MSFTTDRYTLSKLPSQSLAVIECGIQICHAGHKPPKLFYKDYSAHFILEGKGVFIKDGASRELGAGEGFLITPNTSCVYIADDKEPWKYVYASFRGADDDALVHNAGLDENNIFFEFPLDEDTLHDIYAMHRAGKKNEAKGYDVTGYFLLVMSRLVKAAAHAEGGLQHGKFYVQRAKQFIEDNFASDISIADIAAHVRLDRTYLYRLFIKHEGKPPSEYLIDVRTLAAARMLENEELSIREVAANAGFCNVSHFYRKFNQKFGVSPRQFKQKKRTTE